VILVGFLTLIPTADMRFIYRPKTPLKLSIELLELIVVAVSDFNRVQKRSGRKYCIIIY